MITEEEIFEAAVALPNAERAAFLDDACAVRPKLREKVDALLRSHEATGFMEASTNGVGFPPAIVSEHTGIVATVPAEQPGERIGRYRLLQQIGEGGFGTVWMAEQVEPVTRRVALKIIKAGMDTKEVIARFEAERQALAMMDHPNIAHVFDAGATDKGRPYFVMELVKGIPITKFCDEQQFTTRQRLVLFADVCSAINHAHQKGVIHRDVKPSNVMVTLHCDNPVVKVIDFGIAKATQGRLTDRTLFTRFEQFVGTPAYMSPEQSSLGGLDVDTRSDIYALGVLLYELLTGKPPFDTKSLLSAGYEEMRRIIREVEPPKPSARLGTVRGEERTLLARTRQIAPEKLARLVESDLDWIVMKAIEKDRTRRYETANGLAMDIRRFLTDEPVSAGPPTARYRFWKFARRHNVGLRIAAIALIVIVAAAIVSTALVAAVLFSATVVSTWQAIRARLAEKRALQAEKHAVAKTADEKAAREDVEAVTKFLIGIFESPDPARDGRTITVAEMLDRSAKGFVTEFTGHPNRRAKLQGVLGRTYAALGIYSEAIRLEELALHYFQAASGEAHNDTLNAKRDLANSFHSAGRLGEALHLREDVLASRRKLNGLEHPDTVEALADVAESYEYAGRDDDALRTREEVLTICRKAGGGSHPNTIRAMHGVATSYLCCGRFLEARHLQQQTLNLSRNVLGPSHRLTLSAMHILAHCLAELGAWEDAAAHWMEELSARQITCGSNHPETIECMADLTTAWYSTGRVSDAVQLLEQSVEIHRSVLGQNHPSTVTRTAHLAYTYLSAGRMSEAKLLLAKIASPRSSDIFTIDGPVHFIEIAALCAWFEMDDAFAANCRRALALAADSANPSIAERAATTFCLRPAFDQQLLEKAVGLARRAVKLGQDDSHLVWFQMALGMAEFRRGNYGAADSALQSVESMTRQPASVRPLIRPLIERTARLYRSMTLYRQGMVLQSLELFKVVEPQMKTLPREGLPLSDVAFHNDLICWLAYKEARAMLFEN